eukprot:CAMPEP_0182417744 /NCGR_PEP_ID=MMETSP1167-20130531/2184_1 /TAXON_ID=2988 /ORGANISM="Mallomonas Sp, Strain CCMP3275" /LENGTH=314 /DNA_ID=CAMNT_0024591495 /DNA_START=148 /DNA_END=1092 /DNA_ORIENTATION=+
MVQIFLKGCGLTKTLSIESGIEFQDFRNSVSEVHGGLCDDSFYLLKGNKPINAESFQTSKLDEGCTIQVCLRLLGGIDFQHREGSKIGSGGQLSEAQAAIERRERLRKLALETIDLSKDPYFMRNHLGTYECKLCLTLHNNEGNYLAHTQGKRHQSNLARRAAMEAKNAPAKPLAPKDVTQKNTIRIGRPGYKVTKSRDLQSRQRSLSFEVDYPEIQREIQPRHRFMSAYEQKVEAPDKSFQYLLFACEPYETVAFKIPNLQIDKREGRFFTNWDANQKKFFLQLYFLEAGEKEKEERERERGAVSHRPQLRYN